MSAAALDETNDPATRSWVEAANRSDCDFPLQNLPFGVFRRAGCGESLRGGVAIGDQVLDMAGLVARGVFEGVAASAAHAAARDTLNGLMECGPHAWSALRTALFRGLARGSALEPDLRACLVPLAAVELALPAHIGDYTDFYTSIHHATAIGSLFRADNPLLPNYKWVPIGYHGRSSSIVVSGAAVHRPQGQRLAPGETTPTVGPSRRLDYELELGIFVGTGNPRGSSIGIRAAEQHVFGLCLLNDWSARDLQAWEYQPLGPFLAKNFATTISPWIVMLQALAPFRAPYARPVDDPQPLPYLESADNGRAGAIDIRLEALIQTAHMRAAGTPAQRVSCTSYRHAYWTMAQLIAHHTINGCNLLAGDLLGTGTQSGPTPHEAGSLVELTGGGKTPILVGAEPRTFLEDGDRVVFSGWCEKPGAVRIGFGSVSGQVATG